MRNRQAFTLVELLVVIAIISVLAALLLPALESAIASGRQISCANRMKQLGIGNMEYMNDCDDWMPTILEGGNGYNLATASSLVSVGSVTPQYWLDLWPRAIRNCPTVPDNGMAAGWGPKQSDTELYYGYQLPQVSAAIVSRFMYPRGADAYAPGATYNPYGKCEYVRLRPSYAYWYPGSGLEGTLFTTWGGKPVDFLGALPMCSDISYTNTLRGIVAHSDVEGKYDGDATWIIPDGKNSLWLDGHVEWHVRDSDDFVMAVGTRLSYPNNALYSSEGWANGICGEDFRACWYKPARR